MIKQIHELAKKVYKPDEVSPISLYEQLYLYHPETFIVELSEDKVLGYIILCYLNEEDFQKTLKPGFKESEIDFSIQKDSTNQVYFFSIVVDPDLSNPYIATKLIKKFKVFLNKQKIKGFSSLIYSPEGKRLAESFKMTEVASGQYLGLNKTFL